MEDHITLPNVEYELDSHWVLYFHEKNPDQAYIKNIVKIIEIKTIKDFWGTVNNIPMPDKIFSVNGKRKILGINQEYYIPNAYSFFKVGMFPTWENTREGSEVCIKTYSLEQVNNYFNELMLLCISNENNLFENLIGLRVVDASYGQKNNYKIELWFSSLCDFEVIKKYLQDYLNITNSPILYREHLNMKE